MIKETQPQTEFSVSRSNRTEVLLRVLKRTEKVCPHKPCLTCTSRHLCPVMQMLLLWPDQVARA